MWWQCAGGSEAGRVARQRQLAAVVLSRRSGRYLPRCEPAGASRSARGKKRYGCRRARSPQGAVGA